MYPIYIVQKLREGQIEADHPLKVIRLSSIAFTCDLNETNA